MIKKFALLSIRFYQRFLSLDTGLLGDIGRRLGLRGTQTTCRYSPTCSEYTYQAVKYYGIILGLWLGFKRVLRCTPWQKGGLDPVLNNIH